MELADVVALETAVWEALRAGDAGADMRLLSDDFLGVYPSGFADRAAHAGDLAGGPTVSEYRISDARLLVVSEADVLLSYRAEFRRIRDGALGEIETEYISSLWSQRDGRWLNTFSQDTPAA